MSGGGILVAVVVIILIILIFGAFAWQGGYGGWQQGYGTGYNQTQTTTGQTGVIGQNQCNPCGGQGQWWGAAIIILIFIIILFAAFFWARGAGYSRAQWY